jgi:hypothetical protein
MAFEKKLDLDAYIRENDSKPPKERENNCRIAERFNTSEASVRRHRRKLRNFSKQPTVTVTGDNDVLSFENLLVPNNKNPAFDKIFELAGLDQNEYVLDQDSFRFSTWQQTPGGKQLYSYRGTFHKINKAQDAYVEELINIINNHAQPHPQPHTQAQPHTPVLCISDCQIGKAMERGGGTKETLAVINTAVQSFIERYLPAETAVLVDGGDIIENMFNTPSQPYTNDLDLAAQLTVARRMMLEAILNIAPYVDNVIVVNIPSNHGQVRSGKQAQAGSVDADYGLEIGRQIRDAISLSSLKDKVSFITPEPLEETAVIEVSGTKIAFNHGHRTGGPKKHADWWAKQDHGRMPGWDADILVTAHYHNLSVQQSGDARWIIGVSSPEPGSGWFALKTGERSTRGLTAFTVKDKMWYDLTVL